MNPLVHGRWGQILYSWSRYGSNMDIPVTISISCSLTFERWARKFHNPENPDPLKMVPASCLQYVTLVVKACSQRTLHHASILTGSSSPNLIKAEYALSSTDCLNPYLPSLSMYKLQGYKSLNEIQFSLCHNVNSKC